MSILNQYSIFSSMLQDGPFATLETLPLAPPFSSAAKKWARDIDNNPELKTKYQTVRNQIFDLLNISSFLEIPDIIDNDTRYIETTERSLVLLGNMFDIDGTSKEVRQRLISYSQTADDVTSSLRNKILAPYSAHIETTNEIESTANPIELLLILFKNRYHQKARFEAKRKLVLMNLAGCIDQRERETGIASKFSGFLTFLNNHVWSPSLKIGELDIKYLFSAHHPEDFSCISATIISAEEAQKKTLAPGEKLTLLKRRSFRDRGTDIPIYVTIRKKPPAAKVLKLLRKNQKNPATAVDDELGLMAVLNTTSDIKRFLRHLTRSATKASSFMTLEDISDTLTQGNYQTTATGSSTQTSMLKFFARIGGMRVEFIIHTNRSYLDYIYRREVAHDEYEVKRIFDSGVAEFLFPTDIYHLNLINIRKEQIERFRKNVEES